jgi:hypothetical protein
MRTDPSSFTKVFEDAEKAVSGIKNEKLREIAFEKLVSHLLTGKQSRSSGKDEDDEEEEEKTRRTRKKSKAKSPSSTSLKPKSSGPKAWLIELVDEDFFKTPKSSSDIREELETRSHHLSPTDLTNPLQTLCHEKKLRRKKNASEDGGKTKLHWVNW